MGVVALPSAVTGLAAISIMAEITFMPGCHCSSNRSHTAGASGLAWRLISKVTVFVAMMPFGLSMPHPTSQNRDVGHPVNSRRRSFAALRMTTARPLSFRYVVAPRPRLDVLCVHFFKFEFRTVALAGKGGFGGLQKFLVVAFGEIRLVVRAPGFIAQNRALRHHPRQLQHVIELAGEGKAGVGPLAFVAEVDLVVALQQLDDLLIRLH